MNKLNLTFPEDWTNLSDKQLKYIYKLISKSYSYEQIKIFCLFRWNNLKVVARSGAGDYLLSHNGSRKIFQVSVVQIAEIFPFLSWLDRIPDYPVRVNSLGWHKALTADFQGVPFEKFLMAENIYQGYIATENEDLLDQLATVLYPSILPQGKLKPWQRVAVFYWFGSLKNFFSVKFNEFFQPASSNSNDLSDSSNSVEESMNAQIRALTKGDVTKEKEILQLDTWRALEELNAQAREYREFNQKYKNK